MWRFYPTQEIQHIQEFNVSLINCGENIVVQMFSWGVVRWMRGVDEASVVSCAAVSSNNRSATRPGVKCFSKLVLKTVMHKMEVT